jgi:hypothetical protein
MPGVFIRKISSPNTASGGWRLFAVAQVKQTAITDSCYAVGWQMWLANADIVDGDEPTSRTIQAIRSQLHTRTRIVSSTIAQKISFEASVYSAHLGTIQARIVLYICQCYCSSSGLYFCCHSCAVNHMALTTGTLATKRKERGVQNKLAPGTSALKPGTAPESDNRLSVFSFEVRLGVEPRIILRPLSARRVNWPLQVYSRFASHGTPSTTNGNGACSVVQAAKIELSSNTRTSGNQERRSGVT